MRTEAEFDVEMNNFLTEVMQARSDAARADVMFDSRDYILLVKRSTFMWLRSKAHPAGWVTTVPNNDSAKGFSVEAVGLPLMAAELELDTKFLLVKRAFRGR